jgi:hypothetical protein
MPFDIFLAFVVQFWQQSVVREGNIADSLNESFTRNAGYVIFVLQQTAQGTLRFAALGQQPGQFCCTGSVRRLLDAGIPKKLDCVGPDGVLALLVHLGTIIGLKNIIFYELS